jgi:hypothetical protein
MDRTPALVSHTQTFVMKADVRLSVADAALVGTIYSPPAARRPWMLKDALPEGATRYYSLGRWALVDALRACGVQAGDRVLLPGLICREVLASVNLLGATPMFYPVTRQLSAAFDADAMDRASAVVAVNYFGFPQNLETFRRYCERTGAALVEDNAHGFLSRDEHGRWLGSRGDAGIFSFRKTIAVPDGSALVLNGARGMPNETDVPEARGVATRYRVKQGFRRVARRLGPLRTRRAIRGIRYLQRSLTGQALPVGVSAPDAETRIPVPPAPSALILRRLTVSDPEFETQRRRGLYELAGRIAEDSGAVPVFPCLPANAVPYGFPIFVSPAHASGLAANVERYGLPLSRWPELPAAIASDAPEHYRRLMVLPFLW